MSLCGALCVVLVSVSMTAPRSSLAAVRRAEQDEGRGLPRFLRTCARVSHHIPWNGGHGRRGSAVACQPRCVRSLLQAVVPVTTAEGAAHNEVTSLAVCSEGFEQQGSCRYLMNRVAMVRTTRTSNRSPHRSAVVVFHPDCCRRCRLGRSSSPCRSLDADAALLDLLLRRNVPRGAQVDDDTTQCIRHRGEL